MSRWIIEKNGRPVYFKPTYEEAIDLLELLRTLHPTV